MYFSLRNQQDDQPKARLRQIQASPLPRLDPGIFGGSQLPVIFILGFNAADNHLLRRLLQPGMPEPDHRVEEHLDKVWSQLSHALASGSDGTQLGRIVSEAARQIQGGDPFARPSKPASPSLYL